MLRALFEPDPLPRDYGAANGDVTRLLHDMPGIVRDENGELHCFTLPAGIAGPARTT
jgi:hypothetical protein